MASANSLPVGHVTERLKIAPSKMLRLCLPLTESGHALPLSDDTRAGGYPVWCFRSLRHWTPAYAGVYGPSSVLHLIESNTEARRKFPQGHS